MCVQLFLNLGTTGATLAETKLQRHGRDAARCRTIRKGTRMNNSLAFAWQLIEEEDGQDVVEYGLLIATIAIVVLLATAAFGNNIGLWFNTLAGRITTPGTP